MTLRLWLQSWFADTVTGAQLARLVERPTAKMGVSAIDQLCDRLSPAATELAEWILDLITRPQTTEVSMATPYPDTFPAAAFEHVLAALRGQAEVPTLIHDAWEAAGFALGQFVGQPSAAVGAAGESLTQEEAVQRVCVALAPAAREGNVVAATAAIPPFVWQMVLEACMALLNKFLKK